MDPGERGTPLMLTSAGTRAPEEPKNVDPPAQSGTGISPWRRLTAGERRYGPTADDYQLCSTFSQARSLEDSY